MPVVRPRADTDDLIAVMAEQWAALEARLSDLNARLGAAEIQERAEVAGSVPVYATTGDLPTAGHLGRMAAVTATSKLYFDDGTSWREVSLV